MAACIAVGLAAAVWIVSVIAPFRRQGNPPNYRAWPLVRVARTGRQLEAGVRIVPHVPRRPSGAAAGTLKPRPPPPSAGGAPRRTTAHWRVRHRTLYWIHCGYIIGIEDQERR